jgi:hypothetical protein
MDDKYLLNPLSANLLHSDQHLFFTSRNANGLPNKKKKRVNPVKQKKLLEARFNKYQLRAVQNDITDGKYVAEKSPFDIDIVFTWVNNTKEHAKKREYWLDKTKVKGVVSSDNGINRYSNNEELRYAIRSIYTYAPWVRCIFVVVDDQQFPEWLSPASADAPIPVCIVPHTLIYGKEYRSHLPTFNSQSIECHLHKIPNLSEQFIYFNDDMFFGKNTQWHDFFNDQGLPKYVFSGAVTTGKKVASMCKWTMAWINNGNLLTRVFPASSKEIRRCQAHQGCPLLKTSFENMWKHARVHKYLARTSESKFREPNDLYPIGFMVYWNKYMNLYDLHTMNTFYTQITDHSAPEKEFRVLLEQDPTLFCINDGVLRKRRAQGIVLKIFLNFFFPVASPVEKSFTQPLGVLKRSAQAPPAQHNALDRNLGQGAQKYQTGQPFL